MRFLGSDFCCSNIKLTALFALVLLTGGCKELLEPFQPMTEINPCDPASNVYQSNHHYFERDFLSIDGRLDYDKLARLNEPRTSPCDPLHDPGIIHYAPEE